MRLRTFLRKEDPYPRASLAARYLRNPTQPGQARIQVGPMDTIGGHCQVSGFHSLPIRCFLEVWEPEMETDCVRMTQSYGAPYPHNLHPAMQCGSACPCMNADPGVISTWGSEERGRAGYMILALMLRDRSHDGKTSKVRNYAEISELAHYVIYA